MRKNILLGLILLVGALLRFYALDASSLWSDEGNTWALMGHSFSQIAANAAADIHPPGYYWLLKIWAQFFGSSAWGLRSFSAFAGTLLIWVIYRIGLRLPSLGVQRNQVHLALLAALLAALHPLQIYYSQEARMYMLLTLEGALLFWSVLALLHQDLHSRVWPTNRAWGLAALGFVLAGSAGLWTHYSFPILLAAAGTAYLLHWFTRSSAPRSLRPVWRFLLLNGLILISYLPWVATAINRVANWPQGGDAIHLGLALQLTLRTLTVGPLRNVSTAAWPLAMGLFPLLGIYGFWRYARLHPAQNSVQDRAQDRAQQHAGHAEKSISPADSLAKAPTRFQAELSAASLLLWLGGPVLIMFGLGLFSEAFLKFLLSASPAWCLLSAVAVDAIQFPQARGRASALPESLVTLGFITATVGLGLYALPGYYADPMARDNYAGVARYVQAVGNPQTDLVVLDAPGQQEVWRYYDAAMPMLALPQQRPADSAQTIELLQAAAAERHAIFALFWATDEADPERIVESWLDQNAFKGLWSWQGNLRFVNYTVAADLTCATFDPPPAWENQIRLTQWCRADASHPVAAGDVALVQLQWQSSIPQTQAYKVSLQLLNASNQLVAQRDDEPAGGLRPTTSWAVDETIMDNHGLAIPPGTPPGLYQLIAVLYDGSSGVRSRVGNGDYLTLGEIAVKRTQNVVPLEVMPIQHRRQTRLGSVQFVGYDLYKQGFAHAPEQPVEPGDHIHVTLYWQAPPLLPLDWPADLDFVLKLGNQELRAPLAGPGYPTAQWQEGEFVRGEFDLLFEGGARRPTISVNGNELRLAPVP